jgi:hypothetical protein
MSNLQVNGVKAYTGTTVTLEGDLVVDNTTGSGNVTTDGSATIAKTLTVQGSGESGTVATVSGKTVAGGVTFEGGAVTTTGNTIVGGTTTSTGVVTANGGITVATGQTVDLGTSNITNGGSAAFSSLTVGGSAISVGGLAVRGIASCQVSVNTAGQVTGCTQLFVGGNIAGTSAISNILRVTHNTVTGEYPENNSYIVLVTLSPATNSSAEFDHYSSVPFITKNNGSASNIDLAWVFNTGETSTTGVTNWAVDVMEIF